MKTNYPFKFTMALLLTVWVANGNASFSGKSSKRVCIKASSAVIKIKSTAAMHFSPVDVLKW
jgi:hypothetical protein